MRNAVSIFLLALALAGCSKRERSSAESVPVGERDKPGANEVLPVSGYTLSPAIYTSAAPGAQEDAAAGLRTALKDAGWDVKVTVAGTSEYPLPEDSYVEGQVGSAGLESVKAKGAVLWIELHAPPGGLEKKLRAAHQVIASSALALDGFVWDQGSWSLYTGADFGLAHDGWSRGHPFVSQHISVQLDRDDSGERFVTVGLAKFGLPELLVETTSPGERQRLLTLVNLLAQTLVEAGLPANGEVSIDVAKLENEAAKGYFNDKKFRDDASGKLTLTLAKGTAGPQDPTGPIMAVQLPGPGSSGERESAALDRFLGKSNEDVHYHRGPSDAWRAASARAVRRLMELKPRIQAGLAPKETLFVKTGFTNAGAIGSTTANEWMWVDVLRWKGTTITGRLASDPEAVHRIKAGEEITLAEGHVVDYLFTAADGTEEGNETGKVLRRERAARKP